MYTSFFAYANVNIADYTKGGGPDVWSVSYKADIRKLGSYAYSEPSQIISNPHHFRQQNYYRSL